MAKQESLGRLAKIRQDVECALSDLDYHVRQTIEGATQPKTNKENKQKIKIMPAKLKRPMTNKEYCAQEEPRCPYCYSDEIVGGSIQIDGSTAWQPITCLDCGKQWNDIYTIAAYKPVE